MHKSESVVQSRSELRNERSQLVLHMQHKREKERVRMKRAWETYITRRSVTARKGTHTELVAAHSSSAVTSAFMLFPEATRDRDSASQSHHHCSKSCEQQQLINFHHCETSPNQCYQNDLQQVNSTCRLRICTI